MRGRDIERSYDERIRELKLKAKEVRKNIVSMIHKAQSGHPGGSLSAADIMTVLYFDQLNIESSNVCMEDRDRFVLSKGHACPVWYSSLALKGYFPMNDLNCLRQLGSPLQGHPVKTKCAGIDATTGSLGLGFAQAVGMAIEARYTNKDYFVYALLGDGEVQEGVVWEAAQSASRFGLDNLVIIIDRNNLQNDGYVDDIMPVEPLEDKFRDFGWQTSRINGHRIEEIVPAFELARDFKGKPYCIVADTVKGKGVSFMENVRGWHGKAPNDDELEKALAEIEESAV